MSERQRGGEARLGGWWRDKREVSVPRTARRSASSEKRPS